MLIFFHIFLICQELYSVFPPVCVALLPTFSDLVQFIRELSVFIAYVWHGTSLQLFHQIIISKWHARTHTTLQLRKLFCLCIIIGTVLFLDGRKFICKFFLD